MSFSARQVHCLEKMGIVPWVDVRSNAQKFAQSVPPQSRLAGVSDSASLASASVATSAPEVADPAGVRAAVRVSEVADPAGTNEVASVPEDLAQLALWLSSQPLLSFEHRGAHHSVLGSASAPLLVVVQTDETRAGQLPLSDESARLFDLMLRSINLSRADLRLCVVNSTNDNPENQASGDTATALQGRAVPSAQAGVGGACSPNTRAVLLMQHPWGSADELETTADQHAMRLATLQSNQSLPMWRIPHPQLLLKHSSLKRVAWQVLKAIRVSLNTL